MFDKSGFKTSNVSIQVLVKIAKSSLLCYNLIMKDKIYTGIGSRKTPDNINKIMTELSVILDHDGWDLRSGGASGADSAFQKGTNRYDNIFLPWKGFNGKSGTLVTDGHIISEAMYIIHRNSIHEEWDRMINSPSCMAAVKLHTRNVFQILGEDLKTPSKMVVCWTPDGATGFSDSNKITGGTRTGIRLAEVYNIPVFNLKREDHLDRILDFIDKNKIKKKPTPKKYKI